ncbi:copper chaperone PCu(A)C [Terrihabitans sp. B22-R8]|uniref:copper chaperone PCu(A)C n=1 Tax=Terrihabitans sp. B22-R8 TaxID=3425128 RepID=UPI00403CE009
MTSISRSKGLLAAALSFAFILAVPFGASAHGFKKGDLEISHPWSRETPVDAKVGVGYLSIRNSGTSDDRLIAVETSAAAKVEIHQSTEVDGVAKMRPIPEGVSVPAGGSVVLEPGGYHLMLMGLKEGLAQGTDVPAVLVFEKAGRMDVEFAVEDVGYRAGKNAHGAH